MPQYLFAGYFPDDFDRSSVGVVVEAAHLDEALAWARKSAIACGASPEVREMFFMPDPKTAAT